MIKQAFETTEKTAFAALIYGQTGVGKSTLACGASSAIMIDFDGGIERVAIGNRVNYTAVTTWDEALADTKSAISLGYKSVVIDTVGKMIDCIEQYIMTNNPTMRDRKGGLTLKGFGMRKIIFMDYLKSLKASGVNMVFVAQETETEEDGRKIRRPACGSDKMATELLQDIDIAGYLHVVNGRRVLEFGCVDYAWTKNACALPGSMTLPDLATGSNDTMKKIEEDFHTWQVAKVEKSAAYAETVAKIDAMVGNAKTAEELTEVQGMILEMPEVLTSKMYARQAVINAARSIGCKWDKEQNKYV